MGWGYRGQLEWRNRRVVVLAVALLTCAAAVSGFAASLVVTSGRLTSVSSSTTVPTTTCALGASADTYASSLITNANTNFGTATELHVRSDVLDNRRTFVRFDTSSCQNFSAAEVKTATLRLYLFTAPAANRTYQAYRISANWTEAGLTSTNQPATAVAASASVSTGTTNGVTLQWTLTSDVQGFVNGTFTNFGWMVRDSTESAAVAREGRFRSKESAGPDPQLVITYYP